MKAKKINEEHLFTFNRKIYKLKVSLDKDFISFFIMNNSSDNIFLQYLALEDLNKTNKYFNSINDAFQKIKELIISDSFNIQEQTFTLFLTITTAEYTIPLKFPNLLQRKKFCKKKLEQFYEENKDLGDFLGTLDENSNNSETRRKVKEKEQNEINNFKKKIILYKAANLRKFLGNDPVADQGLSEINIISLSENLSSETDPVNSLCLLHDGRLASAGKTIKIFTLGKESDSSVVTIKESIANATKIIQLKSNKNKLLLSSSEDKKIILWDVSSNECQKKFEFKDNDDNDEDNNDSPACSVDIVELKGERFATANKTIKIFNANEPYDQIKQICTKEKFHQFFSLISLTRLDLLAASLKEDIYFWNSNTYKESLQPVRIPGETIIEIREIELNKFAILKLNTIVVLRITDDKTFETKFELHVKNPTMFSHFGNDVIVYGSTSGDIGTILDYKEKILAENAHTGKINDMILIDNQTMASCGNDGKVKIWKLA